MPKNTPEGQLLHDLIMSDETRTKRDFAVLLGVDHTYLSKIQRVKHLTTALAEKATEVFSLEPGYFRATTPKGEKKTKEQEEENATVQLLTEINNKLGLIIELIQPEKK